MKLFVFVLACSFFSVQMLSVKKNIKLIREGDPLTLVCNNQSTKWLLNGRIVAHCENCPSFKCNIHDEYKERMTAYCSKTESVLYFNSSQLDDNNKTIRCLETDFLDFHLFVGEYSAHLRSENNSTYALNQNDFTLVCDEYKYGFTDWYNEPDGRMATFSRQCNESYPNYDTERFNITCDKRNKRSKLHIRNVTLKDDGSIFGCFNRWYLNFLYQLTVNVPVTSVSIQRPNDVLVENEEGIFLCIVEESKPEASFQWTIFYQNESSQQIKQNYTNISKTLKGKLWQTNSTLKLKLNRDYKGIMCKSTIKNLPWINSEYLSLDRRCTSTDSTVPDSTSEITYYVISILVIIIIIIVIMAGIAFIRIQKRSKKNENTSNIPANGLGTAKEESVYANVYDVPRRSEKYDILEEPGSSGQPTGNEIHYDDAMDVPVNQSCNYENQHFYMDVISTTTRKEQGDAIQPQHIDMGNIPSENGFMDYEDIGD